MEGSPGRNHDDNDDHNVHHGDYDDFDDQNDRRTWKIVETVLSLRGGQPLDFSLLTMSYLVRMFLRIFNFTTMNMSYLVRIS